MAQQLVSEDDVIGELKKALSETLRIEEDTIEPDSSLINDLDAESLDFLDVVYQMEQTFGIKMARQQVLEHVDELFGEDTAMDPDTGELTEPAVALLKLRFGEESVQVDDQLEMDDVAALVTVRSLARAVLDIMSTLPEQCASCGASDWGLDEHKIVCGSCKAEATYENGDDLMQAWLKKAQEEHKLF